MRCFIAILLFLCFAPAHAQSDGISAVDFAIQLSDMQCDIAIGKACDDSVQTEIVVYGDLNMNGYTLELLNVKLTIINGQILNEGEIAWKCTNSELIFER